jgi:hypothetical protein
VIDFDDMLNAWVLDTGFVFLWDYVLLCEPGVLLQRANGPGMNGSDACGGLQ